MAKLIGTRKVPLDEVASVLAAISEVPTERRMDVVATTIAAWFAVDCRGDVRCHDVSEWRPS